VWEEALTPITWAWQPETDGERLPTAFRQLIRQAEKWAQPAQLIKQIPPRNTPTAALLPNKQPISTEQREANRQRLQQILNQLLERKKT
jgi:hypothetical protein